MTSHIWNDVLHDVTSSTVAADHGRNLARLRDYIRNDSLTGLIVPRADAHQSEATAPHDNCLEFISGFTGSAGMAVILPDRALLFVDGRYQVQARREVDTGAFEILHLDNEPPHRWLREHAAAGWRIGLDPMRITCETSEQLDKALRQANAELVTLECDPFDTVWQDRPPKPIGLIRAMPVAQSGETSASKRARIGAALKQAGADMLVETLPDNIAWLLNVRGSDVPMNPVPHSFLIIGGDGGAEWFVDRRKLGNDLDAYELTDVTVADPDTFLPRLTAAVTGRSVLLDSAFAPEAARQAIEVGGGSIVKRSSPITSAKALKTPVELEGYRACHLHDGAAVTNFLAWVEARARDTAAGPLTELEAEAKLLEFRSILPGFLEPSFRTISASGANAAMCHYAASPPTNAIIDGNAPYLVDSGGQYLSGTTDVTRTIMLGPVGEQVKRTFTAVLKGFISLITATMPIGTQGHQLDAFARRALWDLGLDFDHGTGHGVGHNLLIHEYPHRFEKRANPHGLEPGNIMTIEPGYYEEGAFGLRVENQVEVVAAGPGFCRFASLTLVPIDLRLADLSALTPGEIDYLDAYHADVRATLAPHVLPATRAYLDEHTKPIAVR